MTVMQIGPDLTSVLAQHAPGVTWAPLYEGDGAGIYHDLTVRDVDEIVDVVRAVRSTSGAILELACGSGRVTLGLLNLGRDVVGLELSRALLEIMRQRLAQVPAARSQRCRLVPGDMTDFSLGQRFGAIVLATTSISLLAHEERLRLYQRVREHLADGGRFILSNRCGGGEGTVRLTGASGARYELARHELATGEWLVMIRPEATPQVGYFSTVRDIPTAQLATELAHAGFTVDQQSLRAAPGEEHALLIAGLAGASPEAAPGEPSGSTFTALWPYLLPYDDHGRDDLCAVRAHRHRITFADGRELLCGTSGLWNTNLGYGNPAIAEAIADAARDASYLGIFRYENVWARRAAQALVDACGPAHYARVIFSTSGGAANDTVTKLARHYHAVRGEASRTVMVGLQGSYHGLTYGSFALTGQDMGQRGYGVDLRLVRHVAPNSEAEIADLLRREGHRVAAVIVEPVLGSGTIPLTRSYVDSLLELRDRYGFLLVADEVATGFGRTGTFTASQTWTSQPDLLVLSKGLTNGTCAAAAVVVSDAVAHELALGSAVLSHAETQGGTAITCAAIVATLAEMRRLDVLTNARHLSERLDRALADPSEVHPWVTSTTGVGCFRTLWVTTPDGEPLTGEGVTALVATIRDHGAIVHPAPAGVQLVPALTYSDAELTELLDCVRRGLAAFAGTWRRG